MRAVVLERPRRLVVREREIPTPGAGELLLKVEGCAIGERDLDSWFYGTGKIPRVPGCEIVGRVVSSDSVSSDKIVPFFGPRTGSLDSGDRVVVCPYLSTDPPFGETSFGDGGRAATHRTAGTDDGGVIGFDRDGGWQEYMVLPADQCYRVSEEWPLLSLLCVPALAEAVSFLEELAVAEGETVLIAGAEGLGVLTAVAAMARGAIPILVDTSEARLEQAAAVGIDNRINPFRSSVPDELEWMTPGGSGWVDALVETTGQKEALPGMLSVVGSGSRLGFVRPIDFEYSVATLVDSGLRMVGLGTLLPAVESAIEILSGTEVGPLVSATFSVVELPERMSGLAASRHAIVKSAVVFT